MSKEPPPTKREPEETPVVKVISGHVLPPDAPVIVADTDSDTITGYYVIIGRGPAAWYNHLTLLGTKVNSLEGATRNEWGKKRLSDLPVIQIGLKESWSRRKHERMGQWPRMLNLFAEVDDTLALESASLTEKGKANDWLHANVFAGALERAEAYIVEWYRVNDKKFLVQDGFAGVIETATNFDESGAPKSEYKLPAFEAERRKAATLSPTQPGRRAELPLTTIEKIAEYKNRWLAPGIPFRIPVYTRNVSDEKATLRFVYAYKVDVCSSYGTPRTFEKNLFADETLYKEHLPTRDVLARDDKDRCPNIIDGNEFIGMGPDSSKTVIVFKGNPVGAQSVQSALDMPELGTTFGKVYYISNADIVDNDAGVPGGRNLLEMVGDADEEELVRFRPLASPAPRFVKTLYDDLPENHGHDWWKRGYRIRRLGGRLIRASFYEIEKIRKLDQRIACTFTLKSRTGAITETIVKGANEDLSHASAFTRKNPDVTFEDIKYYWRWERCSITLKEGTGADDRHRLGDSFKHGPTGREIDKYFAYESSWVAEGETPAKATLPPAQPPIASAEAIRRLIESPKETLEVRIVVRQLKQIIADYLVYALGQQNDTRIEGCAAYLTQLLGPMAPLTNESLAAGFYNGVSGGGTDTDLSTVNGSASATGKVRILGAAAAIGPNCNPDVGYIARHTRHGDSLCREMPAGGGGLNVNLPCIRRANQFVGLRVKINSASKEELVAAGLSAEAAQWIIDARKKTDRGYTLDEYQKMMKGTKVDIKQVGVRYPRAPTHGAGEKSDTLSAEADKLTTAKFEF